jgi:hypothetical protein
MSKMTAVVSIACTAAIVLACEGPTETAVTSIAMTLESSQVAVTQGSTVNVGVSISRTNFDGPVTLTTGSLPAGVSVSFDPAIIPADAVTSMATIVLSNFLEPVDIAIEFVAKGGGGEASAPFAIKASVKGSYSLGLLNPTLTLAQGGAASTTVLVSRANGFPGIVTFSAAGIPAGVVASFDTSHADREFAELLLTATATAATGSQQITVSGKTTGLPDQAATITVNIIAPPATANVTRMYCGTPTWVGYRNEGYGWQRATVTGPSVTVPATDRLVIAEVFASPEGVTTHVEYLSRAEFGTDQTPRQCAGSKFLSGNVAGMSSAQRAEVAMGGGSATPVPSTPNFTMQKIRSGPADLLAILRPFNLPYVADRVIIRRGLDITSGGVIPTLDFASEGFAPETATLSLTGLDPDESTTPVQSTFLTATSSVILKRVSSASTVSILSVPLAQMSGIDIHALYVEGTRVIEDPASTTILGRIHTAYYTTTDDRSVMLTPNLAVPTLSVIGTAQYVRGRALLPSQPEYPTMARLIFYRSSQAVLVTVTAAYLGGTPATWDIVMPHFGTVEGFNNGWGLKFIGEYEAQAWGGPSARLFGAWPKHGDIVKSAYRYVEGTSMRSPGGGTHTPTQRRERISVGRATR